MDEKLQVKLACAGIIVCGVVSIALLMGIFFKEVLLTDSEEREDIANLVFYVIISTFSIAVIISAYFIERGSKRAWVICAILGTTGLICNLATFVLAITVTSFIGLAVSIIVLLLLLSRTIRDNCGIEFRRKGTNEES